MANSSSSCGLLSSTTSIHTNTPSLQHFSPDFDAITTRMSSFETEFKIPDFYQLVQRVEGVNGVSITSPSSVVSGGDESPRSFPPNCTKFVGLVSSPDLIREKWKMESKERKSLMVENMICHEDQGKTEIIEPLMAKEVAARVTNVNSSVEKAATIPNLEGIMGDSMPKIPPCTQSKSDPLYIGKIPLNMDENSGVANPFSNSNRTTLSYITPEIINGEIFVRPTWEVAKKGMKRWENTAVGYFIGRKVSFMALKNYAFSVWNGLKEVKGTSNGFFFFCFESENHMNNIIEGGPWLFAGQPLFLERWKEGMSLEKHNHKEVPIWVKFRNLPIEYWTQEGLSMVASSVGRPLYPDAFTSSMARLDYARVCVVVNINSKFQDHVFMLLPSASGEYNGTRKILIEYEWRPSICSLCESFGHKDAQCPLAKKVVQRPKPVHIYVPKPSTSNIWEEPKLKSKNAKLKEKQVEMENMVKEVISSPTRNYQTHAISNEMAIGVTTNPFAILGTSDMEELNDTMYEDAKSQRGPNQAAPTTIDR